jgi:hypothetical protein
MAADGWFSQWFAGAWFPPVWFAPADDEHLTPEERATTGGTRRKRVTAMPGWYVPKNPPIPAPAQPDEEEAALMCMGLI